MAGKRSDRPATTIDKELQEFLLDRQARNLTRKTLQWYRHSLKIWRAFLDSQSVTHTADITPSSLRAFLVHLT